MSWRGWKHCTGNTRGTWLPWDPRGHRERNHRTHIDGDYKRHPEFHPERFDRMKDLSRGEAHLPEEIRHLACGFFGEALLHHGVEIAELSIGKVHWHLDARFVPVEFQPLPEHASRNRDARHLIGIAKKWATTRLSRMGLIDPGGLWARACGIKPVADQDHHVSTVKYIRRHARQGSAIWSYLNRTFEFEEAKWAYREEDARVLGPGEWRTLMLQCLSDDERRWRSNPKPRH